MESTAVMNGRECLAEEDRGLELTAELNAFLREVERRAYRIAAMSIGDRDEALDLVQDAMISLTRRYSQKPPDQWRPLFYRILGNRIRDWHRRRRVRDSVLRFFGGQAGEEPDPIVMASDSGSNSPEDLVGRAEAMAALERGLAELPPRQREAFVLRTFEGLDVAETAMAMRCSDGSVKTHFSRATHRLRELLDEYY